MHKNIMVFGILESMPSACPGSVMPVTGLPVQVVPTRKNPVGAAWNGAYGKRRVEFSARIFPNAQRKFAQAIVAAPNVG